MTAKELRKKYIEFFKAKGHKEIPSASLIPEHDPTVLFTTAGMHPLIPYLLGEKHPAGRRLVGVQKCLRTDDIDEVGDSCHLTFFEMLGNWSLGDYFKKEAIEWSFEFLTSKKWLGIPKEKLAVSVFEGDDVPQDKESAEIWLHLGIAKERIAYLGREENWWGPAGQIGPCGPDTEMFFWTGEEPAPKEFDPNDKRWVEIWNDVFMQYNKRRKSIPTGGAKSSLEEISNGTPQINTDSDVEVASPFHKRAGHYKAGADLRGIEYEYVPLRQKNIDTGMGLERTLAALNGKATVYETELFEPIIRKIADLCGQDADLSEKNKEIIRSMRIIADHMRAATFILGDEKAVTPSNKEQGYVLRRLVRRSIRHGFKLNIKEVFTFKLAETIISIMKDVYPELKKNKDFILNQLIKEEEKFRETLERGLKEFQKITSKTISGEQAFHLYDTYGFPLEITLELAEEEGKRVDVKGFERAFAKHRELSRASTEQKFKSGLADTSEISKKYHTATHLLHAALRQVLGKHVKQKGSNITAERLRFDFSHPQKMTEEEKKKVEELVNKKIIEDLPVICKEMTLEEARKEGAIGLFDEKYGEKVKVYLIGDPKMNSGQVFSKEICSGPHVSHTGELGHFKIKKEEAVSAGIRRIKAVLEPR